MPHRSDQALLADMDHGSREVAREALRVLYERHAEALLAFLCRLSHDVNIAEDILQESFLVASRNAGSFREGSARPWLLSIAASRLKSARRAGMRRERREAQREVYEDVEHDAHDHELEAALEQLPTKERAVLDLRYHAGLGFREVAEVLGVSRRTAQTWSASGLERLRKLLGEGGER